MKLIVTWRNAARGHPEKQAIETAYRDRLLGLCEDNIDMCNKLHEEHFIQHQRPCTEWAKYTAIAHQEATQPLLPSERRDACFTVRFDNDV